MSKSKWSLEDVARLLSGAHRVRTRELIIERLEGKIGTLLSVGWSEVSDDDLCKLADFAEIDYASFAKIPHEFDDDTLRDYPN